MKRAIIVPIAIAVLILLALATANAYRVPTVQLSFVEDRPSTVRTVGYTVDGLKCRGRSGLFAQQISDVSGVVSLTTYVRTHTAIVEYDPTDTDPDEIKDAFSEPVLYKGETFEVFHVRSQRELD